jgi:hypothetical protein
MEELLRVVFENLNRIINAENEVRMREGAKRLGKAKVVLLGQASLLVDKQVSAKLALAQTGDVDAKLEMDSFVKQELKILLEEKGLVYDEDSDKIFIPAGSRELDLFEFDNITVRRLDPESVLVSKAVKAPEKNRPLIIEGTASAIFPELITRIEEAGGDLKKIFGGDDE